MADDTNPAEPNVKALIERVRELDKAATPGPWHVGDGTLRDHYLGDSTLLCAGQEPLLPDSSRVLANLNPHYPCAADANLIAEYRTLAVEAAAALEAALSKPDCTWTYDPDGFWKAGCGRVWYFDSGDPRDNGVAFCPFCGNPARQQASTTP